MKVLGSFLSLRRSVNWWVSPIVLPIVLLLAACSGGSGGGGSERQIDLSSDPGSSDFVYAGPAPASDAIQNFKLSFYDQLAGNDRCGECHTPGEPGATHFVDQSDVNRAWQQAQTVVNLNDPGASVVVQRVSSGHNCWLGAEQAATCATTMTGYIERWAAGEVVSTASVQLIPRLPINPEGTQVLPPSVEEAAALGVDLQGSGELLGILKTYCSDCHSDTAPVPQVPFFASDNPAIAYDALRGRINLSDPGSSRVVLRLAPESHNCWSDCDENAAVVRDAIARLSMAVPETEIDAGLLISMAQVLERDGIIATSGGRFESNVIAKWEFREGAGTTTADTSGVSPEIPLSLSGEYSWLGAWGVRFINGKAQGGASSSGKVFQRITGGGEYSIEAWVAPANVSQEEAWIAGYAGGPDSRNMLLRQSLYDYEAFNRSTVTEDNNGGEPALTTADAGELAQATLQHVVVTYDPVVGRQIYVNGVDSGIVDPVGGGLLNNWSEAFAVVLGNTTAGTSPWTGAMRMVAIHNAALNQTQIQKNFEIGVGQKYFLLFSVAEQLDLEGQCHIMEDGTRTNYCYVVFEVSQFDDTAYLFKEPFFANLNPDGGVVEFDLSGIRLGINGRLAEVGQAFVNVNASIAAQSQPLSEIGSIVPLENGADQDVFFLAFDSLQGQSGIADDGADKPFQQSLSGVPSPDVAMRTFDEINASFAALTGVPVSSTAVSPITGKSVAETFATVRRALPGAANFQAFMSSHLMAATQLAAAYCDALVQSPALRENLFPAPPTFDFSTPVASATIDWRVHVVSPLVDRAINTGLLSAADRDQIVDEIELLITDSRDLKPYINVNGAWVSDPNPASHNKRDGLMFCTDDALCPASRTAEVVKGACTAVLASGLGLMQ